MRVFAAGDAAVVSDQIGAHLAAPGVLPLGQGADRDPADQTRGRLGMGAPAEAQGAYIGAQRLRRRGRRWPTTILTTSSRSGRSNTVVPHIRSNHPASWRVQPCSLTNSSSIALFCRLPAHRYRLTISRVSALRLTHGEPHLLRPPPRSGLAVRVDVSIRHRFPLVWIP